MLRLLRRKKSDPKETLRELFDGETIPSFPAVVTRVLDAIRDEESSMTRVSEVLASDPGLSTAVLKTANSAAYSLRHSVGSVTQAVTLLGRSEVEALVLSVAVQDTLPRQRVTGFDSHRFWRAAARRACTAQELASILHPSTRSESFTASLLQDMALPVLAHHRSEQYGPVLERWHHGEENLAEIEHEIFEWDHAEVAGWMCEKWGFPENLAMAIDGHHGVAEGSPEPPAAVSLVSFLKETEDNLGVEELLEEASSLYNLPQDSVKSIIDSSFEKAKKLAAHFG